ncbi:MAG TPA: DUF1684 domain-containing protein [Bryobacteraceae bacterium]|nr:DUF1684 domain-containing protein [Bryobacteraceae bacterium]
MLSRRSFRQGTLVALFTLSALCTCEQPAASQDATNWQKDLLAWRAEHAADLQKPDGWLALAGLVWLEPGDNSVGSAADNKVRLPAGAPARVGVLHLEGTTVSLRPPASGFPEGLLVDGKPAQAQDLHTSPDNDKGNPRMTVGALNFYAVKRGDRFALRIKDANAPTRVGFHGLKWYPPNAHYRITAKWIPYDPPKTIQLATMIGTAYDAPVPGRAEFQLDGATYRLEPITEDKPPVKLFFILKDATSATKTYGACRFLYTPLPSNGIDKPGELVLDFNHLENPPCAYTPFATCPLPQRGNRLKIALPVGELRYHE